MIHKEKTCLSPERGNLLTTPYMRVLSILSEIKKYIFNTSKGQSHLIDDIEWILKVIIGHSLYSYDFTDKEKVEKYKRENSSFRQFANFVSEYNEKVIELNKEDFLFLSKNVQHKSELMQQPSLKIKRHNIVFNYANKKLISMNNNNNKSNNVVNVIRRFSPNKMSLRNNLRNNNNNTNNINSKNDIPTKHIYTDNNSSINAYFSHNISAPQNKINKTKFHLSRTALMQAQNNLIQSKTNITSSTTLSPSNLVLPKQSLQLAIHKHSNSNNIGSELSSLMICSTSPTKRVFTPSQRDGSETHRRIASFNIKDELIFKSGYDLKKILTKEFDIFELKSIVGHDNVLPIMGKTILESFGINDKMINTNKLDSFLKCVSEHYIPTVLYHNSIHGADVTQTVSLFFHKSNAEELLDTNVLDILSTIISSIGHDIGHPGLTNNFQINSLSEMAITYNDISCLENYHTSMLFKILLTPENNIFDKVSNVDYRKIRKRMISMILATDMANHGKIISVMSAKVIDNKNKSKIELISNNPKTKFEEQQSMLDFFVHSADLAHNTKLFSISIQWVELLSNEFWIQGDKEKSMNLPVSFLCERIDSDIPNSQVGFIKGFIIPTFNILVTLFPTLNYTVENAKDNLKEWEKLAESKRKRGWTPQIKQRIEKYKTDNCITTDDKYHNTEGNIKKTKTINNNNTVNLSNSVRCKSINKNPNSIKPSNVTKITIINKDK